MRRRASSSGFVGSSEVLIIVKPKNATRGGSAACADVFPALAAQSAITTVSGLPNLMRCVLFRRHVPRRVRGARQVRSLRRVAFLHFASNAVAAKAREVLRIRTEGRYAGIHAFARSFTEFLGCAGRLL